MRLSDVLAPVTVAELRDRFFGKQCLVIKRKDNPLAGLLRLEDIEARLNDGVSAMHGLTLIGPEGRKHPGPQWRVQQSGTAWAPSFVAKGRVKAMLEEGMSLVMHNMSAITPGIEELVRDVEGLGDRIQADLHIYLSPRAKATGYNAHRDQPQHKLYIQLLGSTEWTVYKGHDERRSLPVAEAEAKFTVDFRATLTPGSVLYMPPAVFHHASNPTGPRVSLSLPFYESPQAQPVDRTPIELAEIFAES